MEHNEQYALLDRRKRGIETQAAQAKPRMKPLDVSQQPLTTRQYIGCALNLVIGLLVLAGVVWIVLGQIGH